MSIHVSKVFENVAISSNSKATPVSWLLSLLCAVLVVLPRPGLGGVILASEKAKEKEGANTTTSATLGHDIGTNSGHHVGGPGYFWGGGPPNAGGSRRKSAYPRILTVLTTFSKRSGFVKAYKESSWDRDDGYRPPIFVVSNEDDEDLDEVVDFRVGSRRGHRSLAAITEACKRYEGKFDWLALGDDDTTFMYNRAKTFLRHIDHTQPVAIGRVDGLSRSAKPAARKECYSPEDKLDASKAEAANGCCKDFTRPCRVPPYPLEEEIEAAGGRDFHYDDYGPRGLYWPYGGSGTFVSAGLVIDAIGGTKGWGHCASVFGIMRTDVQFAQCLKLHGYSMGRHPEGFAQMETSDTDAIRDILRADCQIIGVHLGMNHLKDGTTYTPESFGHAVASVRDEDMAWMENKGRRLNASCHESWAELSKWKSYRSDSDGGAR